MKEIENAVEMLSEYHKGIHYLEQSVKSVITNLYLLEAQLKAKDEEIERLKEQTNSVHNLMYKNGYRDAIDCYDTYKHFGIFRYRYKPNAKARSIVAMLFWNSKKEKQKAIKADVSMAYGIAISAQDMFNKAYKMLKDNA